VAVEESQQFCAQCQRFVLARRPGTNHIFHLLMCVFTCGLWVIIWFLSSAKVGGWRCSVCGGMQFGQAYGAPQVAGAVPVKSGPPRALMLVGAGIGGFFALVLLIGMCSAAASKKAARDATVAESEARMRENAAAAAKPTWQPGADVAALETILAGSVKPLGVDKTGDALEIERYSVPGWPVAQIARSKKVPRAWGIYLDGATCSVDRLAPSATLREDEGNLPMSAQWYRLHGGPLDGMIAYGATKSSPCNWNIGTPEYAALRDWKHRN
jgi:hypothetical protein